MNVQPYVFFDGKCEEGSAGILQRRDWRQGRHDDALQRKPPKNPSPA